MKRTVSDKITKSLDVLKVDRVEILNLCQELLSAAGGALYGVDLLAIGAFKRFLSCSDAFIYLIESKNSIAAKVLLRTHIDTALRFSAIWLVAKPEEFSTQVLQGTRIDKLVDRKGKHLRDAYLIEIKSDDYPWLKKVYENLSGFVHFSSSHSFGAFTAFNDEMRTSEITITSDDEYFPDSSWEEIIDCFHEVTCILQVYLTGWRDTKASGFKDNMDAKNLKHPTG